MDEIRRIRLFTDKKLILGGKAELSEKASHYLCNVMRCNAGEKIRCFNETDGEFLCRIEVSDKKKTIVRIEELLRLREKDNDIWLLFAPLKKDQTDFVIAKAVELGVSKIIPIITERTNSERVKVERFAAQAVEAAEQCGRLSVPEVVSPVKRVCYSLRTNAGGVKKPPMLFDSLPAIRRQSLLALKVVSAMKKPRVLINVCLSKTLILGRAFYEPKRQQWRVYPFGRHLPVTGGIMEKEHENTNC